MNWLDKAIAAIAPEAGFKRQRARTALDTIRSFDGASKGRRTDGWTGVTGGSVNNETRYAISVLRNRARDLVRNNPYAASGVQFLAHSIVGYGITASINVGGRNAKRANDVTRAAWSNWAETTECDFDDRHNLYGLQSLAARTMVEAGEVLVRRRFRRAADGLTVPMQIQVLEPDFIDHQRDGVTADNGNTIIQGIEFDSTGRRVAYYLWEQHPGESIRFDTNYKSNRVPVDQISHIYKVRRPGQVRGYTELAPVILRLRDFDEYEDAQLVRQKIAACFSVFVHDQAGFTGEATGSNGQQLPEKVEPGIIEFLPPGKDITFADPPGVSGYGEYARVSLIAIAAGMGIPYEALTGDYSGVNFSSARMGQIKFHRNLDDWQYNIMIPQMCGSIWSWWREAAMLAGLQVQDAQAKWTPPRRELVDPTKEIPALITAMRAGLTSPQEALRSMGESDPVSVLDDLAQWNKEIDQRGVIIDSDPRKVTGAGNQIPEAVEPPAPPAEDDLADTARAIVEALTTRGK